MSGKRWVAAEADIERAVRIYEQRNVLAMSKVAPPTRTTGRRGALNIIHLKNPFLDYIGSWTERGGRSVHIEVKSTLSDRLPIRRDNGVTESQVFNFIRWGNAGSALGLVWLAKSGPRWVSVERIIMAMSMGEISLKADQLEPIRSDGMIAYNFLPHLRADYP